MKPALFKQCVDTGKVKFVYLHAAFLGQDLKLDMTQFEPCLEKDQTLARVKGDTQDGQKVGVRGISTCFVNSRAISLTTATISARLSTLTMSTASVG